MRCGYALLTMLLMAAPVFSQSAPKHSVTVKFNYDFGKNPACTAAVTKKCVKQFIVYDVSIGRRTKLFTIPAPPNARGMVKGITGKSEPLPFAPGNHIFAVTAEMADGAESDLNASKAAAKVRK
ncbi:MAG: hypothetical protein ACRD4S_01105 [Candidatus Acidiferrales bacterium]